MSYESRLSEQPPILLELLPGSLPSVDELQTLFSAELADVDPDEEDHVVISRMIAKAADIRTNLYPDSRELLLPERDILSITFLDLIEFMGESWFIEKMSEAPEAPEFMDRGTIPDQISLSVAARKRVLNDLSNLAGIYGKACGTYLFDAVEALIYDAHCLILNKDDLSSSDELIYTAKRMRGLVAEVKIVEGLRGEGWNAYYSSVNDDIRGKIDAIAKNRSSRRFASVPIQIKSNNGLDSLSIKIETESTQVGNMLVVQVPVNRDEYFLNLPPEDRQYLSDEVSNLAVQRKLAFTRMK